jgi:hypothetical protein
VKDKPLFGGSCVDAFCERAQFNPACLQMPHGLDRGSPDHLAMLAVNSIWIIYQIASQYHMCLSDSPKDQESLQRCDQEL